MFKYFTLTAALLVLMSCSKDDIEDGLDEEFLISSPSFERSLIALDIDQDGTVNGKISNPKIPQLIYLSVSDMNITDLSGIEHFKGLKKLDCFNNQLSNLDVRALTLLKELNFSNNNITSIDVSKNINLTSLVCFDNQLTSLDVSQNTSLATLACTNNLLTSLDVSSNTALSQLYCSKNQLESLDVSQNVILEELYCYKNQIKSLDLISNVVLAELYSYDNALSSLNLKNGNNSILTELNTSGNNQLDCIEVDEEASANIGNTPYGFWIIDNTAVYSENCNSN